MLQIICSTHFYKGYCVENNYEIPTLWEEQGNREKLERYGLVFKGLKIMAGETVINIGTKNKNTYKLW